MGGRVVVVGSSNTDMVLEVPQLPVPGQTVLGKDLVVAAGGKGANQAVASARLGADVTFVARLGDDSLGDQALEGLRKEGIHTDFVFREEGTPSGVALILVGPDGENMIAVASGSNSRLSPADIDAATHAIREADVVLIQLEVPLETVHHAAVVARAAGATVILNPAPAVQLPGNLLREVSILTPNISEARILTGTTVDDLRSARAAAQQIRGMGVETVVITMGSSGVCSLSKSDFRHVQGWEVEARDATAAGDAFSGALACGLAGGEGLDRAVDFANAAAALTVTRLGAQPSLPDLQEVLDWLQKAG